MIDASEKDALTTIYMYSCSTSIFYGLSPFRSGKAEENKSNMRTVRDARREAGTTVRKTEHLTHEVGWPNPQKLEQNFIIPCKRKDEVKLCCSSID